MRESLLVSFILRVLFLVSLILLMVPLERIWAVSRRRFFREGMFTDVLHFFANPIGVRHALAAALVGAEVALAAVVPVGWREFFGGMHIGAQFGCVLFAGEFLSYWTHRASHSWTWLWRFHAIHHSVETMDWLAGARLHLVDVVLTRGATYVPIYILGFSEPAFFAYLGIVVVQATFIHANVRWEFPRVRWLLVTPCYHHWHHSAEAEAVDKNFAVHMPIWDWLFGTYHMPGRWPDSYGLAHDETVPPGWPRQFVYPFTSDDDGE
jgi:sterol desaturase/sphingolipid hydroxylase (fatty acid hydroxylase superfamily)